MRNLTRSLLVGVTLTLFLMACDPSPNKNAASNDNSAKSVENTNAKPVAQTPDPRAAIIDLYTIDNLGGDVRQPDYNMPYKAIRDTTWSSDPASSNPTTGKILAGKIVLFNRDPLTGTTRWQDAKLEDGTIKYVRPVDFQKAPPAPPVVLTQLVAEFHTQDDDKDRGDGISESYYVGSQQLDKNQSWGKDLIFRDNSFNLGQTFDVASSNVPFSRCNELSYKWIMDNDDGWKVVFKIYATFSNGQRHLVGTDQKEIGDGGPREGTIPLRCN